jgi:2-hydroxy-6-oxonona-2,4-dienedioate hydrolase
MHGLVMGEYSNVASRPFVLVHGLGMSGRYMMPTAELLAHSGRVYLPDLPGFGKSGRPSKVLTIPELGDALAAWLEINRIDAPVLIGNSLGAQVIVDFVARYPDRLHRVVLVAPTVDPAARRVSTQVLRLLADIPREPMGLYGIALGDYFRAGLGRVLQTLRHALEDPIVMKLPRVSCPVLIVRGGRDPIVPQEWVEQAARLVPDCRLVVFPGAAHAVNFSSPELLVDEVLRFVALEEPG